MKRQSHLGEKRREGVHVERLANHPHPVDGLNVDERGEDGDRRTGEVLLTPNRGAEVPPVHAGHHEVGDDEIGGGVLEDRERLLAVFGDEHPTTFVTKHLGDRVAKVDVVLDQKHLATQVHHDDQAITTSSTHNVSGPTSCASETRALRPRSRATLIQDEVGDDVGDTPEVHRSAPALRVLVVEPDETTREALAVGLADDYLVTTTHEAAAALAILADQPFDGIVIDASEATAAPDAVAAVERLVAAVLARAPGAAVIVTSTHDGVAPSARRLGVPYVAKPFSLRAVASSLAVALVRRP